MPTTAHGQTRRLQRKTAASICTNRASCIDDADPHAQFMKSARDRFARQSAALFVPLRGFVELVASTGFCVSLVRLGPFSRCLMRFSATLAW